MFTQKSPQDALNIEFKELSPEEESKDLISQATAAHQQYILRANNEDLINAINLYIKAIKINPDIPSAYYRLASLMHESGQIGLEGALEQCRRAVELDPKNASARMYLGYFLSQNGEYEKATEEFKAAMKLKPTSSHRARLAMALAFLEKRKKSHGSTDFNDLNFARYRAFGKILEKSHLDKNAYELYSDALDNTKNAPLFYEKMAGIAIKKERPEVALQCYQNAVQLSNHDVNTVVDLIEFMEENFPERIDDLIEGEPDNPFYQNSLAFAYVQLEQYDSAIELYKQALENNPDNEWTAVVAQALAAIYHRIKGNFDAAISMLQNALILTKNKTEIYLSLADIYYDIEDMDEAIKYYTLAIEGGYKDAKVFSRLAMAFWERDYVENAIEFYTRAIDIEPDYEIAYNNLGVVYFDGLNDAERAKPCFEAALKLNDNYTMAHFNMARYYETKGNKVSAANEERLFKLFET